MTDLVIPVDHLKIDYKGAFEFNQMLRLITSFFKEMGWDAKYDKDFEMNTKTGKQYDYQLNGWKKISDYTRYTLKIQIGTIDMVKKEILRDNKKFKVDYGRIIILIDGFMDLDYFNKWNNSPVFLFIRALYNKFVYKVYTERFEQRLVSDMNLMYNRLERFFNMYNHYSVISRTSDGN